MPSKREVLDQLKRDELLAAVDQAGLDVRDRRMRGELLEALASSRKAPLAEILGGLPRTRLKEICRALDLDDSGREKALLVERLAGPGRAHPPEALTPSPSPASGRGENSEGKDGQGEAARARGADTNYCGSPFFVIDIALYVAPKVPLEMRLVYSELLQVDINSMDSGSAIPSTSRQDFDGASVLAPFFLVQECFVKLLRPLWLRQTQNELESQLLTALREALLPKLISGELRVRDAERLVCEGVA